MKIKICGMKYQDNILEVAELQPDYMGFIFYEKSPRFLQNEIPEISSEIKKTGVFVNAEINFILEKVKEYDFQAIQLHGNETPEYCKELRRLFPPVAVTSQNSPTHNSIEIIKAFSIGDSFNFREVEPYLDYTDYFLFDTKGKHHGGNGTTFNWQILNNYPYQKPFFLSGGIGLEELPELRKLLKENLPVYAIDINSKFETEPAKKSREALSKFKNHLFA